MYTLQNVHKELHCCKVSDTLTCDQILVAQSAVLFKFAHFDRSFLAVMQKIWSDHVTFSHAWTTYKFGDLFSTCKSYQTCYLIE